MRKLAYDVAVTVDGFIAHEDGGIEGFVMEGDHLTDYIERLKTYDTVLMGRGTYEWGYSMGLKPGQRAYPHMKHFIFSKGLELPGDDVTVVRGDAAAFVKELKGQGQESGTIYLSGGGAFAGALFDHDLIDELTLKVNPVVFGRGIRLFGPSQKKLSLSLVNQKAYTSGVVLLQYAR